MKPRLLKVIYSHFPKGLLWSTLTLTLSLTLALAHAQAPKGGRMLAYQVDMAQNADYDSAYAYALDGCMESIHLFFTWSGMEPDTASGFDPNFVSNFLILSNLYYPAFGTKAELQIAPINTNVLEMPAELSNLALSDPVVINRFKRLLDTVFAYLPDLELKALNIGNESDIWLGTDPNGYADFRIFLDAVIPHAKQRYFNLHGTDLKVGTTFTLDGLTDPVKGPLAKSVNNGLDIVTTTYYPLKPDFTMHPPSVVAADFAALVAEYPDTNQPIYFAEVGYASSSVCNSSDALQAQFFENVFDAWDTHRANIRYLTIFKTTDWSQADVDTFANYYGIQNLEFKEYLRTLGIRTWPGDGANKPAYEAIKCALSDRNWCSVNCPLTAIASPQTDGFGLKVVPNPAKGAFSIRFENPAHMPVLVTVTDIHGRVVRQFGFTMADHAEVHAGALAPGIYFARLDGLAGQQVRKFIVSR